MNHVNPQIRKRRNSGSLLGGKKPLEGIVPAPAIKPMVLDDLKQRDLALVEHHRGVATQKIHCAHFTGVWGNPPIHTLTVDILDHCRALRLAEKVGLAPINWEDVRQGVERACAASGLTDFHLHDLRRKTFVSWLIMRGIPISGHTSRTMTLCYAHLSPKHLTATVRVLDVAPSHPDRKAGRQWKWSLRMPTPSAKHADSQSSDYRFGHVGTAGTVSMNLFLKDAK